MQRAQPARGQVLHPAERVDDLAAAGAGQAQSHRVHGEVAAREVLLDRRPRPDLRQSAGARVALAPQHREVELTPGQAHRGRAEAGNGPPFAGPRQRSRYLLSQPLDGAGVAVHGDIDIP